MEKIYFDAVKDFIVFNKALRKLNYYKVWTVLECFTPTFNKHAFCKDVKGTKLRPLKEFLL